MKWSQYNGKREVDTWPFDDTTYTDPEGPSKYIVKARAYLTAAGMIIVARLDNGAFVPPPLEVAAFKGG